ncbi:MAG TPA: LLM class flavin-dependent oxidoreductase [Candidatus Limnocylindrales bacterium]
MIDPLPRTAVWSGLDHLPIDDAVAFVRRVEDLGFGAFWTREGFGRDPFVLLAAAARATNTIVLATGIANVYARDPIAARAAATTVDELAGGRFILGLGVSHVAWVEGTRHHTYGPPRQVLATYLNALESAEYRAPEPHGRPPIVLAALRPGLFSLARDRTRGAFPYLTPVEGVSRARAILDGGAAEPAAAGRSRPWLVVSLAARIDADGDAAQAAARAYVANYVRLPAYVAALREYGFGDEDLGPTPSDRLVNALVATGDRAVAISRIRAFFEAGADQVAIVPLRADGTPGSLDAVEALAPPW